MNISKNAAALAGGPRLLSLKAVAERVSVSTKTLRRMIGRGELPVIRVGRQIRIAEDELMRFLNRRRE
jgi:excisionase family DNA binding protein